MYYLTGQTAFAHVSDLYTRSERGQPQDYAASKLRAVLRCDQLQQGREPPGSPWQL